MKSYMEKALDKLNPENVTIMKVPEPKPEHGHKKDMPCEPSYYKPTLYLDDKDLATINKYKAGDKIVLVIECEIHSTSSHDRMDDKKMVRSYNADLKINSFADITR